MRFYRNELATIELMFGDFQRRAEEAGGSDEMLDQLAELRAKVLAAMADGVGVADSEAAGAFIQ